MKFTANGGIYNPYASDTCSGLGSTPSFPIMFKNVQKFVQWFSSRIVGKPIAKYWYGFYDSWNVRVRGMDALVELFRKKHMAKLGIVGDLSMQDPARLDKVMAEAVKHCDIIINVGDVHPGYDVMKRYLPSGKVFVVPGNHDQDYDTMGTPRQWLAEFDDFVIVGIDNSEDELNLESWELLDKASKAAQKSDKFLFVIAHKPLSSLILPDGSENSHTMEHGKHNIRGKQDAELLREWLSKQKDVLLICGHWHGFAFYNTRYANVLVEGRGGAAGGTGYMGYTKIIVQKDGWVLNKIDL